MRQIQGHTFALHVRKHVFLSEACLHTPISLITPAGVGDSRAKEESMTLTHLFLPPGPPSSGIK